ncbi:hypothetical protein AX14_005936 [Amanita brunnescens Koide BX004]|nr:hypothetical protein AX14_005936 [Amanita brunnescens Koide BX004]
MVTSTIGVMPFPASFATMSSAVAYLDSKWEEDAVCVVIFYRYFCIHRYTTMGIPTKHLVGNIILGSVGIDGMATGVAIYAYISDENIRGNLAKLCVLQAITYLIIMFAINLCTWYSDVFEPTNTGLSYAMTLVVPNFLACRFILDLRKETNPTATQIIELVSIVVRDGLADVQPQ